MKLLIMCEGPKRLARVQVIICLNGIKSTWIENDYRVMAILEG